MARNGRECSPREEQKSSPTSMARSSWTRRSCPRRRGASSCSRRSNRSGGRFRLVPRVRLPIHPRRPSRAGPRSSAPTRPAHVAHGVYARRSHSRGAIRTPRDRRTGEVPAPTNAGLGTARDGRRVVVPGRPGALLRRAPLRTRTCGFHRIRLKQALMARRRYAVPDRCLCGSRRVRDGRQPRPTCQVSASRSC